jgi:hypothetical protein
MSDDRAMAAIERIERALGRIEAASAKARSAPRDDGELIELRQSHQALRTRVEGAIGQIDRLLASQGG